MKSWAIIWPQVMEYARQLIHSFKCTWCTSLVCSTQLCKLFGSFPALWGSRSPIELNCCCRHIENQTNKQPYNYCHIICDPLLTKFMQAYSCAHRYLQKGKHPHVTSTAENINVGQVNLASLSLTIKVLIVSLLSFGRKGVL